MSNCSSSLKFNCFLPSIIIFWFSKTSFFSPRFLKSTRFVEATAATERCVAGAEVAQGAQMHRATPLDGVCVDVVLFPQVGNVQDLSWLL